MTEGGGAGEAGVRGAWLGPSGPMPGVLPSAPSLRDGGGGKCEVVRPELSILKGFGAGLGCSSWYGCWVVVLLGV